MGKISDHIRELIERQVRERGIVVWYDPERVYSGLIQCLEIQDTAVVSYEKGFFHLREQIEPFLEWIMEDGKPQDECGTPPRVLIYIPMARDETHFSLIEAKTTGTVMEPGAPVSERNTRFRVIVEQVFQQIAPEKAAHTARKADDGLLSLEELDQMAEEIGSISTGSLKIVFEKGTPVDILLDFLSSDRHDKKIMKKKALPELITLVKDELGINNDDSTTPDALRKDLTRKLLLAEFVLHIPEEQRSGFLKDIFVPKKPVHQEMIKQITNVWRQRMDLQESYQHAAIELEGQIQPQKIEIPNEYLREVETFLFIEFRLLQESEQSIIKGDHNNGLVLARARKSSFWHRVRPDLGLRWSLVEEASGLIEISYTIGNELKKRKWTAKDLISAYTSFTEPWMLLDQRARHLESRYARCEAFCEEDEGNLARFIQFCRRQYNETLGKLTETYTSAIEQEGFRIEHFQKQTNFFKEYVVPCLKGGKKIAYFLVDALRYEMAKELCEGLQADYDVHIEPALAQLPGITLVGMAALLPGAENKLCLDVAGKRMNVQVENETVNTRSARLNFLEKKAGVPVAFFKLGDVVRLTPKRKKEIDRANLIIVTSQEIDRFGEEGGDEEEVRIYMDDVLEKLRRGIRTLSRVKIEEFIIVADHGFLFVEGLEEGLKMDPPGGKTVYLSPRAWIGQGGTAAEGYFRVNASDLELEGPLECAFPRGLGLFKTPGPTGSYFHGGASLQEHVIPIAILNARPLLSRQVTHGTLTINLAKMKITNRFFSATLILKAEGFFTDFSRRIRLEVLSGKEEIGYAAMAAYGYDEGAREILVECEKPNAVTIMITAKEKIEEVTIKAIDCDTQLPIATVSSIPVELL